MSLRPVLSVLLLALPLASCGKQEASAELSSTPPASADQTITEQDSVFQGYDPSSPSASLAAQEAGRSRSTLSFVEMEKDLGNTYQFHDYDVEFAFEVEGPDPVVVTELNTSCGCTGAKIFPRWEGADQDKPWPLNQPIPAGAKAILSVTFNGERAVNEKTSTITVRGNMPEGKVVLGLKAWVLPVYELTPVRAMFGEMLTGSLREEDPSVTVQVTAMQDFEVLRWKRVPRGLTIQETGERGLTEDGRITADFTLTATKGLPEGNLSSSAIAETSLGVDLEIQAVGVVLGAIKYAPNQRVAFGIFDEGTKKVRTVKVESTLGLLELPEPTVELSGDAAKVVNAEVKKGVSEDSWEIKLRIGDAATAGSYNGVLRISYPEETGIEAKEIVVNARIRPAR
jgi:hypothetical protein